MGDIFQPFRATSAQLNNNLIDTINGQLIVSVDTQSLYHDVNNQRIKITDVIVDTYSSIRGNLSPLVEKIYLSSDQDKVLYATRSNNTIVWHEVGGVPETQTVTNSNASVSIELSNNTIYNLTNANISSISLTAANSLDYCTICFTAGTSTTFTSPSGSTCIGDDCANGTFTPVSGRSYQIAVDVLNNSITLYVLAIVTNSGVIINSDATISLTLVNDTIYRCTSTALSSLTIAGLATGFRYAAITFTSPATATTFAMPATGYYCVGASCTSGTFTPKANMRYNLAIEDEGDRIAIYVMEAL